MSPVEIGFGSQSLKARVSFDDYVITFERYVNANGSALEEEIFIRILRILVFIHKAT